MRNGLTRAQLRDIVALMRDAAHTEIMPRFRRLGPGAIRAKTSETDLVTDADEAAEARIAAGLKRMFPHAVIIGEEGAAADPSVLGRLADAELAFVVDPIDGTNNYAMNVPLFGVMVAAIMHGEVVASAILDPVSDDTALALRGEGAWMETPEGHTTDLHVARPVLPERMTGVASWRFLPEPTRSVVLGNLVHVAHVWDYRCAAHQYRVLAAGRCHFMLFYRLMPWDHLPGWLLHHEAGGYSAHFDGTPYRPGELGGGLLCTPDRESWENLHEVLFRQPR